MIFRNRWHSLALAALLLILVLALSGCQPLDTFGKVLTQFSNALANLLSSLVNSIRLPEFPVFR